MNRKLNLFAGQIWVIFSVVVVFGLLSIIGCGGNGDSPASVPINLSQIHTDKNITSLEFGETADIAVSAVDSSGNEIPFTAISTSTCFGISQGPDMITVAAGPDICSDTVTIEAGDDLTKTISINVFDPMTMDIGEGLLIKYVHTYSWVWRDVGATNDGHFWHPNVGGDGWYALGSYIRDNWDDVNATLDAPVIVVKDSKNAGLLSAPTSYTKVWDDSGSFASWDGSIWSVNCPDGYKGLGIVANQGHDSPSLEDVRCVREDFTATADFGDKIWDDSGSGAALDIGIWPVVTPPSPTSSIDDNRAPLPAGTMGACSAYNTADPSICTTKLANLLLVPTPILENSENNIEPKLTGYTGYDTDTVKFFSSVRIPFTLIPEVRDNLSMVNYNVTQSPFYSLQRQERYVSLVALDNRQSSTATPLTYTAIETFDVTQTETFSQTIGLSVTVEGGADFLGSGGGWSVTLSTELGWEQSTATSFGESTGTAIQFTVPPGAFAEILQVETLFQAIRIDGYHVGSPLSAGKNTVKYLQYPL